MVVTGAELRDVHLGELGPGRPQLAQRITFAAMMFKASPLYHMPIILSKVQAVVGTAN